MEEGKRGEGSLWSSLKTCTPEGLTVMVVVVDGRLVNLGVVLNYTATVYCQENNTYVQLDK